MEVFASFHILQYPQIRLPINSVLSQDTMTIIRAISVQLPPLVEFTYIKTPFFMRPFLHLPISHQSLLSLHLLQSFLASICLLARDRFYNTKPNLSISYRIFHLYHFQINTCFQSSAGSSVTTLHDQMALPQHLQTKVGF